MPTYVKIIIGFVVLTGAAYVADTMLIEHKDSELQSTEFDFRQAKWGMSPKEVVALESLDLDDGWIGHELRYETEKIAGYEAYVTYGFSDSKLIGGAYDFTIKGLNANINNDDINKIKDYLISKHGPYQSNTRTDIFHEIIKWKTQSSNIIFLYEYLEENGTNGSYEEVQIVYYNRFSVSSQDMITSVFIKLLEVSKELLTELLYEPRSTKYDFRQTNWGMTVEEVLAIEIRQPYIKSQGWSSSSYFLEYRTTMAGIAGSYSYYFTDNQLDSVTFRISDSGIDDFYKLKDELSRIYGEPKYALELWRNNFYKDNPEQYDDAIAVGHLLVCNYWETKTTSIEMDLINHDEKLNLKIYFDPLFNNSGEDRLVYLRCLLP